MLMKLQSVCLEHADEGVLFFVGVEPRLGKDTIL
jgi:hypothetical protein